MTKQTLQEVDDMMRIMLYNHPRYNEVRYWSADTKVQAICCVLKRLLKDPSLKSYWDSLPKESPHL